MAFYFVKSHAPERFGARITTKRSVSRNFNFFTCHKGFYEFIPWPGYPLDFGGEFGFGFKLNFHGENIILHFLLLSRFPGVSVRGILEATFGILLRLCDQNLY